MTLMDYTCGLFRCTVDELYTRSRKREIVSARHVCMSLMREFTIMSFTQIGWYFNQGHSNTFLSIKSVNDLYDTDKEFRGIVDNIRNAIKDGKISVPNGPQARVVDYIDEDMKLYASLV